MTTPYHRNRILIAIAAAVFCGAIMVALLSSYAAYSPACNQPCSDPRKCTPLALSLKVSPERLKRGEILWHRIEIRNQSCMILGTIQGNGFVETNDLQRRDLGLWISITGPDGKELKRQPPYSADGGARWNLGGERGKAQFDTGTIHPYRFNRAEYEKFLASKTLDDNWFLDLNPGQSFSTIPSEVHPYRIVTTISDHEGGVVHGYGYADVENPPSYPLPPVGFRELDLFDLTKPGHYSIKAGFNGRPSYRKYFPHWDALPRPITRLLYALGLAPDHRWVIEELKVSVETKPVEFEVVQ